jgi:N-acetylglucosamine transport system substrate-binding protein
MTKDQAAKIDQLFKEVAEKGLNRREMIQRAGVLGISAWALTFAFVQKSQEALAQGDDNPLGVDPAAPLDVVVFKGGYGDEYAINVNENLYGALYPDAEITYAGTQRLMEQYQARVVDGNPPDVMDNSGAGNFSSAQLYRDGQLADLDDLMAAPAYGQEDITFADSLADGTQDDGQFDGKQYVLNYAMTMWGLWYNAAKFEEKGWEYPKTWDEMLALCQTIKDDGEMAPWTYQGMYPQYMRIVWEQMLFKAAGFEAHYKLNNLAEDAWTQPKVKETLDGFQALADNGYILEGTEALSHTEAQTFFLQGEAAFIPSGTFLENEMKDVLASVPDFELTVQPMPNLNADDALPFEATQAGAGETFIVFAQGKNVQGGKEWLRLLFSKEGAAFFSEATHSPTAVIGAAEGLDLGSAFASAQAAIDAAGENRMMSRYTGLYPDLNEAANTAFSELLTGQKTSDEMIAELQALTDELREDDSIQKIPVPMYPVWHSQHVPAEASPEASPAS